MEWNSIPRPKSPRIIRCDPVHPYFKPQGIPLKDIPGEVNITLEELETIRLSDFEGLSQNEVGKKMKISQSTVSRHLEEARHKVAKALTLGYGIHIVNPVDFFHCESCGHTWQVIEDVTEAEQCESCNSSKIHVHVHSKSEYQIQSSIKTA